MDAQAISLASAMLFESCGQYPDCSARTCTVRCLVQTVCKSLVACSLEQALDVADRIYAQAHEAHELCKPTKSSVKTTKLNRSVSVLQGSSL